MRNRERALFVTAFLLPATVLYGLFVVWPVAEAFGFSLYRWRGVSLDRTFVGLDNFRSLLTDPVFRMSLLHNLVLLAGAGAVIMMVSLLAAHVMHGVGGAGRLLRAVYLFPQIISMVVVAILWSFIYNPEFGLVNAALRSLHLPHLAHAWLGEASTALPAVAVTYVWHGLGFYIMLFSAGLRTIPTEVHEAAELDGALGWTRFRRITFPMLWAVLRVALIYLTINALNVFVLVYLMTVGGPDRSTEVVLTYLYELGIKRNEYGMATALAVFNFGIVMLLSGALMLAFRRNPQEAAT
jgi:N-acetylglucosamine transport system permease protein